MYKLNSYQISRYFASTIPFVHLIEPKCGKLECNIFLSSGESKNLPT